MEGKCAHPGCATWACMKAGPSLRVCLHLEVLDICSSAHSAGRFRRCLHPTAVLTPGLLPHLEMPHT